MWSQELLKLELAIVKTRGKQVTERRSRVHDQAISGYVSCEGQQRLLTPPTTEFVLRSITADANVSSGISLQEVLYIEAQEQSVSSGPM